ncbi:MAG: helicase-related protein [Kiritimatiellae bacterium]|nr:helicase-related protein [Kiritimatiellia bacterium]MDW8459443.1 helicase-related protein [Verrucomicrobiota bacterium]
MNDKPIQPGDVLEAPFWPEPVRVVRATSLGRRFNVECVGTQSQKYYSRILSDSDVAVLRHLDIRGRDFRGRAEAFFLGIEAHRVRFAQQFDPIFAVNTSQVDPLPHQIEAVYHYILQSPRIRFLLADDPGAGKTIMTGLLLKELKYRGLVRRVLIVVPGHLKDQWLREMKERFGETFTVVDRSVMDASWGRNIWQEQPQAITSMDFGKQDDVMATLAEVRWDIVVVDEAHKMAAYRYGDKTDKTGRYRLGELLSRTSQFLLFLTATPHRGDPENFRLFLDLLVPAMFANTTLLRESIQNRDNPLFLRRLKEDLRDFEGRPLFPPRRVFTKAYRLNDDERRLYNAVTQYVQRSYNKALQSEKRNVAFALLILQRRLASSVRAVRRSLERRNVRLEQLLSLGQWLAEGSRLDEDELEDASETERLRREEELVERLTAAETREELQAEIQTLGELIRLAKDAERHEVETKLNELRRVISEKKIQETREKLLIFTESRETLEYLVEKLKNWGYTVAQLHGGMSLELRIRAEHDFREKAQVMVSTEAGGEGINLQFCSLMVNYDLPWNPNRLEQRMGRIHRYGQQREVNIYNLVAADTLEGKVMQALFQKLERIRDALGSDRVFDVIGEVIPGRTLKDLIVDAIAQRRTLDEIIAEIETVPDEEAVRKAREAVLEALATRHIDISRLLGEDRRAREHRLVPEYIEQFFLRGCRFLSLHVEQRRDGLWRVPIVPWDLRNVSLTFKHQFGEVFSEYHKLAFDKQIARRQEAVFVAPGHPLLESIIEQLLQECVDDLRRGAQFADPDGRLDGWIWFLIGELRDGADLIAGQRLYALYQPRDGDELRLLNSSVLWDLVPHPADLPDLSDPSDQPVLGFAIEHVLESYRAELLAQRQRDAAIKQKYGVRSLEQMLLESQAKLIDYETRRAKGEPIPDVELRNEERRREELQARKQALEEEIQREISLLPSAPQILGVARVIPKPAGDPAMRSDAEIEAIGMHVALVHERAQGRTPTDVSRENLGYDIRSEAPDGAVRYIEVKARAATGPIVLTPNEWLMAQRLGPDYWLYVVENAASEPKLFTLQNPAGKLRPEEVVEIVRFVVKDWRQYAE